MFRMYKKVLTVSVHRLYIVFRSETLRSLTETSPKGGDVPLAGNFRRYTEKRCA